MMTARTSSEAERPTAIYTTCIFCKKSLGSNEVLESFPVGRRLAFDAAKGRLWVVCTKCRRWNLTPLEERWEAVETCERIFRGTRTRASTDNIGLARHKEGLDLVRIGKPPRDEFAAGRYGAQFVTRKRRAALGMAAATGGGLVWVGLQSLPIVAGLSAVAVYPYLAWLYLHPWAKVRIGGKAGPDGAVTPETVAKFRLLDLNSIRVVPADGDPGFGVVITRSLREARFEGEDAHRVAATIVAFLNGDGGSRAVVQRAVHEIESSGHPSRFLADLPRKRHRDRRGRTGYIRGMPKPVRLALEMSLHEEQERRALEGELWILEQAWKEAEEIAAISDSLLLPARTDAFFERYGQDG